MSTRRVPRAGAFSSVGGSVAPSRVSVRGRPEIQPVEPVLPAFAVGMFGGRMSLLSVSTTTSVRPICPRAPICFDEVISRPRAAATCSNLRRIRRNRLLVASR